MQSGNSRRFGTAGRAAEFVLLPLLALASDNSRTGSGDSAWETDANRSLGAAPTDAPF